MRLKTGAKGRGSQEGEVLDLIAKSIRNFKEVVHCSWEFTAMTTDKSLTLTILLDFINIKITLNEVCFRWLSLVFHCNLPSNTLRFSLLNVISVAKYTINCFVVFTSTISLLLIIHGLRDSVIVCKLRACC